MAEKTNKNQTVSGFVTSIGVSGEGPNSAEIVVSIDNAAAYAVYAYPSTEPSVFSSFVSLLTGAYLTKAKVDLTWVEGAAPTPQITAIVCPSAN
jgi:hypothetical protein